MKHFGRPFLNVLLLFSGGCQQLLLWRAALCYKADVLPVQQAQVSGCWMWKTKCWPYFCATRTDPRCSFSTCEYCTSGKLPLSRVLALLISSGAGSSGGGFCCGQSWSWQEEVWKSDPVGSLLSLTASSVSSGWFFFLPRWFGAKAALWGKRRGFSRSGGASSLFQQPLIGLYLFYCYPDAMRPIWTILLIELLPPVEGLSTRKSHHYWQ